MRTFMRFLTEARGEVFGWLTPSREFIATDPMKHLEAVYANSSLKKYVPWLDEDMGTLKSSYDARMQAIDDGEHPEWHGYEMLEDGIRSEVIDALYKAGCLRVGSHGGDLMYFEGTPEAIKNLYQKARDLAESHGKQAKFEPRRRV
jgi:hypothetical protein